MWRRASRAACSFLVVAIAHISVCAIAAGAQTTVDILVFGPGHVPARVTRADAFLLYHGGAHIARLATSDNRVSMTFDGAWPANTLALEDHRDPPDAFRILIAADDLVPTMTDSIGWPSAKENGSIKFPNHPRVTLRAGQRREYELTLRKPRTKRIRVVDDATGAPFPAVPVSVEMFVSDDNHCAVPMEGDRLVTTALTGRDGRVTIPDGDIEYFVKTGRLHTMIVRPNAGYGARKQITSRLPGPETTIRLKRFKPRPLSIRVMRGTRPASGMTIIGYRRHCESCDLCVLEIGRTDRWGLLNIREFYPDEFEALVIVDDQHNEVWSTQVPESGSLRFRALLRNSKR